MAKPAISILYNTLTVLQKILVDKKEGFSDYLRLLDNVRAREFQTLAAYR
jgi:hypothetical protein